MIGTRFKRQSSDTQKSWRHLPLFEYENFEAIRFKIVGQSFLYNQIRKMIGIIIDICRNSKDIEYFSNTFLEEKFEPELRELTRSEGQILSKLIYRETGITVYDLIREYRSGWSAFWWNTSANWYDIDIKQPYQPSLNQEDRLIENKHCRKL